MKEWCGDYQWAPSCYHISVGSCREVVEMYIPAHKIYDHNLGLIRKNRYIQARYIYSEYTITVGWLYWHHLKTKKANLPLLQKISIGSIESFNISIYQ